MSKIFPNPCTYVKETSYRVLSKSKHVRLNSEATKKFVEDLFKGIKEKIEFPPWSESHFKADSVNLETLIRYIFVIDTLNYCFWPNPPFEYFDLAKNLHNTLVKNPKIFEVDSLVSITPELLKENVFKCDFCLLNERARMIREVFTVIKNNYNSSCIEFVSQAKKNAVALVKAVVDNFPCFRDQAIYEGEEVFFYKRAQILVSDLHLAYLDIAKSSKEKEIDILNFGETISELTMFADYRVPQVLREKGILVYDEELSKTIDDKKEIRHGSDEEIEIRAGTIVAVEIIKKGMNEKGRKVMSIEIDVSLWEEGEKIKEKIKPAHRTLSIFY